MFCPRLSRSTPFLLFSYLQVLRWVDPLAEHLIIQTKSSGASKDLSTWVMRSIENDVTMFNDGPGAAKAVSPSVYTLLHLYKTYFHSLLTFS